VPRQLLDMREEEDGQQQMLAGAEQVTSASTEREPWRAAEGQGLDEKAGLDAAEDEQQQAPATGGSSLSAAAASPNRQAAPLQATSSLTTTGSTGLEGDLSPDSIQVRVAAGLTVELRPVCIFKRARIRGPKRPRCPTVLIHPLRPTAPQGGQSAPPDLSHSKSWLRRVQNRTEELRRLFGLPVTEVSQPARRDCCRRCAWRGDRAAKTCTGADRPGCCTKTCTAALGRGCTPAPRLPTPCALHSPAAPPAPACSR
jgi:hypothetical protein